MIRLALAVALLLVPLGACAEDEAGLAAVGPSRPGGYLRQALVAAGASRDDRGGREAVLLDFGAIWRVGP